MQRVRIGCSGWSYKDWRGGLYPDGLPQRRWLERYAGAFDTVEVNATFYRLPKESTVRGWVEQVPADFLFAVKASRYLTHMKRLHEITDAVARFWEPLEPLRRGRRLGPVLWQLPENFHRDDDLLAAALDELPRARHCFEFRHPSWFAAPVRELLEERGASLAIGDDKRRPLPEARPTGELVYLRLHYGRRGRGGNYSEAELDGWRRRIAAWRSRREVFVYLNNDWKGYAPANARYLTRGLSATGDGSSGHGRQGDNRRRVRPRKQLARQVAPRRHRLSWLPAMERRTQTVFGAGYKKAGLMLVGEQPGDREDIEGEPFVGPAGGVLARALRQRRSTAKAFT